MTDYLNGKVDESKNIIASVVAYNNSVLDGTAHNDLKSQYIKLLHLKENEFTAHQFIEAFIANTIDNEIEYIECLYSRKDGVRPLAQIHNEIARWLKNVATHTRDIDSINVFGNVSENISVWQIRN